MRGPREIWLERDGALSAGATTWVSTPLARCAATVLAHSGDSLVWVLLGVVLWWLGAGRWAQAGERILLNTGLTLLISTLLKYWVQRPRPTGEKRSFYLRIDQHSFPSGHAVRIGGLWVVLPGLLPLWGTVTLVLWGVSVVLSRVALGLHYVSDVAAGLPIGAVAGLAVLMVL